MVTANAAAAGTRLTLEQAFRDVLWQESERQRLGLPGGPEVEKSRREAVIQYRRARPTQGAIDMVAALPSGASLTPCGARLLQKPDSAGP
jgi:hypothetical protein